MTAAEAFGAGCSWGIIVAIVAIDVADRIRTRRQRKAKA